MSKPFSSWSGPRKPKCVMVGEAWGREEESTGLPLVGATGKEHWLMLGEAFPHVDPVEHRRVSELHKFGNSWINYREKWLESASIAFTNVLNLRPPDNKIPALCCPRRDLPKDYTFPAIETGKYLRPEYLDEVYRLYVELEVTKPNLIVALGGKATWAILRAINISQIRGYITQSKWGKCLPSFHPANVLYNATRVVITADYMKAAREMEFPQIEYPRREIIVNPSIQEVEDWTHKTLLAKPRRMAWDTETKLGQIRMVSFAWSESEALVIPFTSYKAPHSYWADSGLERRAWDCSRALLGSAISKVGQNILYDLQYTSRRKIGVISQDEDLMLLHAARYPELRKGLDFIASYLTNEAPWKLMRRKRPDTEKKDE